MLVLLDWIVIVLYLGIVAFVAIRIGTCSDDPEAFSVNRRKTGFWLIVASLVANNAGAATFLVGASTGYATGVSYGLTSILVVTLGYSLLSRYAPRIKAEAEAHRLTTMGEFVLARYGSRRCQLAVGGVVILAYLLFLAAQLSGFSLLMQHWIDVPAGVCFAVAALVTVVLTAWTGLRGDFYTDAVHLIVMIIALVVALPVAVLTRSNPVEDIRSLPMSSFDPFAFGGEAFFIGGAVFGVVLLFASMDLWQHIYALDDNSTGHHRSRSVFLWAAAINLPILAAPILLGLLLRARNPGLVADQALPTLVAEYLPTGLRGLAIAAVLAAVISTANSMILVVSLTLDYDVLPPRHAEQNRLRSIWRARVFSLIIGIVGAVVAASIDSMVSQLVAAFQMVAVLAPALLFGLISKSPSERAGFWSTLLGAAVTLAAMLIIDPKLGFIYGIITAIAVFVALSASDRRRSAQ